MTTADIRAELQQNIDEKYRAFHASLVPGIGTFLGVRVPKMREIAKKAAKEELKQMIPTLRGQLNEVTSGLDELNGLLKKITRS